MSDLAQEQGDAGTLARHLIGSAGESVRELRRYGRTAVRIRMNPLDAEAIVAGLFPDVSQVDWLCVLDLPVVMDEATRLGEPVAEFV